MIITALSQFKRKDNLFSLCGLNCSLCPNIVRGNCPGCRAGSHCASVCPFAPCSVEHGDVDYCFECDEYPCKYYDGVDEHDSLISHLNQLKDMEKAKTIGIEKYHEEQLIKVGILEKLLDNYDNGHRDVFFCLAVNLMPIDDLNNVIKRADEITCDFNLDKKSDFIKQMLMDCASKRSITLKLRNGGW